MHLILWEIFKKKLRLFCSGFHNETIFGWAKKSLLVIIMRREKVHFNIRFHISKAYPEPYQTKIKLLVKTVNIWRGYEKLTVLQLSNFTTPLCVIFRKKGFKRKQNVVRNTCLNDMILKPIDIMVCISWNSDITKN